ncbi:MAG: hypothetical protein IKC14_05055 [Kiritimatiellae bacterium]|nr:hypothetical protein [Kiritimatiellia bacterium]
MEREVMEYVRGQGKTLDQLFIDYLHDEMMRKRAVDDIVAKCDEAERDISEGRVSDGFEMLDRVGASVGV